MNIESLVLRISPVLILGNFLACSQPNNVHRKDLSGSFSTTQIPNPSSAPSIQECADSQFYNVSTMTCDPIDDLATFCGGDGSQTNPYRICTAKQLDGIRGNYPNGYFILAKSIDLKDFPVTENGSNFHPIEAFAGFDGGGEAIRNLVLKNSQNKRTLGFFDLGEVAFTNNSNDFSQMRKVKNLNFENLLVKATYIDLQGDPVNSSYKTAYRFVGGVAAVASGMMSFENLSVQGSVQVEVRSPKTQGVQVTAGGLAAIGTTCDRCSSHVHVDVKFTSSDVNRARIGSGHNTIWAGGLFGATYDSISRSYSDASVSITTADGMPSQEFQVGGLIGVVSDPQFSDEILIENSYSRAEVNVKVGRSPLVQGTVGGFLGNLNNVEASRVSRIYAAGRMVVEVLENPSPYENVELLPGALISRANDEGSHVLSSYWDLNSTNVGTASSPNYSDYGFVTGAIALSPNQMRDEASYVGWDFTTIWKMSPSGYPILR